MRIHQYLPRPLKEALKPFYYRLNPSRKYEGELGFWRGRWEAENHHFRNDHYKKYMLGMAGEENDGFLQDKIVVDFGCGPRGSLCWCKAARLRIGVDVLADQYAEFAIRDHNMCYVTSSEKIIPLPTGFADVVFTINAIDHVDHFETICSEILRILHPGGELIASFNLEQPVTRMEPQTLTENSVKRHLLDHLTIKSFRQTTGGLEGNAYQHFFDGSPEVLTGERYLWVRAQKPLG